MKNEMFDKVLENRIKNIREVLQVKAKEYVRNDDRLHNFNVGSSITGQSRERVLFGFMLKHWISYMDILDDLDNGAPISTVLVQEKVGDLINYLILFEASIIDRTMSLIDDLSGESNT